MSNLSPMVRAGIALGFLALSCTCCGGLFFGMVGLGGFLNSRVSDLTAACDGTGVPGAAPYTPGPTVHLTTPFERRNGAWNWEQPLVPTGWRSNETSTTELVLCFEPEEEAQLESCPYTTGLVINRVGYRRRARLVVAQTGQVLTDTIVPADMPPPCTEWASGSGTQRYEGPHVDGAAVERVFRGIIGP